MRKQLFDILSNGDNTRDAILQDMIAMADDEHVEYAYTLACNGCKSSDVVKSLTAN